MDDESNTSDNNVTIHVSKGDDTWVDNGANDTNNSVIPEEVKKEEPVIATPYTEAPKEKKELAIDPKSTANKAQLEEVTLGKYFSVKQVATALSFGRAYINLLIKEGRIKGVKILGGQWRIPHSEYERLTKEGIVPMRKMKEQAPTTQIHVKRDDVTNEPPKAKEKEQETKAEDKPMDRFPHFRFNFFK